MKILLQILIDKYFGLTVGVGILAVILLVLTIAQNIGISVSKQTLNTGWMMVCSWGIVLLGLTVYQTMKKKD